jgi:hypothetical protein
MPTDTSNVRFSEKIGSQRPTVRMTLLTTFAKWRPTPSLSDCWGRPEVIPPTVTMALSWDLAQAARSPGSAAAARASYAARASHAGADPEATEPAAAATSAAAAPAAATSAANKPATAATPATTATSAAAATTASAG